MIINGDVDLDKLDQCYHSKTYIIITHFLKLIN